jgi:anaerobic magnesium-protoporphyrin IX monomethyl ester cyclase
MAKVVFIDPSHAGSTDEFNCGLLVIGSYLHDKGHDAKLFFATKDIEAIEKAITQDTLFVGFSSMTTQLPEALRVTQHLKNKFPDLKILYGGYHATLYPEQTLKHDLIDFICTGDGEEMCEELIEALEGKRELSSIQGFGYKENGQQIITAARAFSKVDILSRMNYELIHNFKPIKRKLNNMGDTKVTGVIYSGKGCPFVCTFCINAVLKKKWQGRPLNYIFDEIEWLIKKHGVNDIYIVDELFFVRKQRFFQWLDEIEKRGLEFTWVPQCRAGYINDNYLTQDVLARMKRLGCKGILLGIESGSQRMLNKLKKGMMVNQAMHAVKELGKVGIIAKPAFIIGLPGETKEDMLYTFKLILEMYKENPELYLHGPSIFRPYPGGPMYTELVNQGFVPPQNLEDWKFTDSGWNDRYLLEKSPWIEETDLVLDIKDTLNVFYKFKPMWKFNAVRAVLKTVYDNEKLMKFCLNKIPKLDYSTKSLFRPDLEKRHKYLLNLVKDLDVYNQDVETERTLLAMAKHNN